MRIKILSFLLVAVLSVSTAWVTLSPVVKGGASAQGGSSASSGLTSNGDSNQLKILTSGDKLTQEQIASRIKAEYLVENGGYKDTDEVIVMIGLSSGSVIDEFNAGGTGATSVAAYAQSFGGTVLRAQIEREQQALISLLYAKKLITGVEYTYSTVTNAIAVKTTYGNLEKLEKTSGVVSCALSETYNRVQTVEDSVAYNPVEIDENTGIYKAGEVIGLDGKPHTYTGKGTVVAVLDSGFDMSHSVFNIEGYDQANEGSLVINKSALTKADTAGKTLLSTMNASKTTNGLTVSDVWYSNKIPYSYDYADKDADVFPYDSEHGTHVAGIIAGQDDVIKGIAPDAQLVLMKVFPDLDAGGKTEDIIAALEDAVRLNVDAINMSLGSSCGFSREHDDDVDKINVNNVYDAINESGISLITAASNSYSSGYGGEQGNTNFVTNPDSGTVGSPSTYKGALSVASISGTKSRYMIANMSADKSEGQVILYKESNSISGKENDFYNELLSSGAFSADGSGYAFNTFEYVVVPGVGVSIAFEQVKDKLAGKIAVVRRGENSFEEKAKLAKKYGAVACIIYNNIDGDILMSMGKTDHIPTVSISKDDGEMLVRNATDNVGTLTVCSNYTAGPFMSDFSSWGPTPSLEIKPEITAHGGNIYSAVPGSYTDDNGNIQYRYDQLSGTSMATPNLCGIVVLIRQYIKDNYKQSLNLSDKDIKNLANQLMMSTADIVKNEENNPYSPRKQGAGLANFANTVKTKAYITVDGLDRSKIELGDDKNRTGVYTMTVNVVNISSSAVSYDCSLVAMTESVSTSDDKHVAETPYMLGGATVVKTVNGTTATEVTSGRITVPAGQSVKVEVTYTLDAADKKYIDSHFENGMYVEGFLKFKAIGNGEVDLNAPFLAFYGDWTEAPMFDKTYYEVESTAHDDAIDYDDKIKADYYATTPYGSYFYNYMIPLGTYLYDTGAYDAIPATEEHASVSDTLGAIDGISTIGAGLLRGAKEMYYTVTDKVTGEVVWSFIDHNASKSYAPSGAPMPYYESLRLYSLQQGFINNHVYVFSMTGLLDYNLDDAENPGGLYTNKNNSFSFEFTMDNEAPILKNAEYTREYDETEKKYRYYITLTVYDNHYAMSVNPVIFTSSSTYTFLTDVPIPVNGQKGQDCTLTFEITDYLEDIYNDSLIPNAICFSIDDYALNTNIFVCKLPGTAGEFKFTKNGENNGEDLIIFTAYENELIDLKKYLYTADETIGESRENEDYLSHLTWISSNENVIEVDKGVVKTLTSGRATVTVRERMDGLQAVVIINVKKGSRPSDSAQVGVTPFDNDGGLEEIRFSHFQTAYAHALAAQTSEIGSTGSVNFISASNGTIKMYPGERVTLYYEVTPWHCASNYELYYETTDPTVASVDAKGNVRALAEGYVTVTLKAKNKQTGAISYISATVGIEVKNPFVIENRTLIAYKGIGGEVEIPDDEGILYIGSYAFCLYTTDRDVILDDDDYDANKVPDGNSFVTRVIIPEGVEEIQKYAFYNCVKLESVVLPTTLKYIREYSFYGDVKLKDIRTRVINGGVQSVSASGELGGDVLVIGAQAFAACKKLEVINLEKITSIGVRAFDGCVSLKSVNLETLRNTGREAFKDCTALTEVITNEHTKLSYAMFARSGLKSITLYETKEIPEYCFAKCASLESVTLKNSLEKISTGAFSDCSALTSFVLDSDAKVSSIGDQAFYNDSALTAFELPDCEVSLGAYCFYMCGSLKTVKFNKNTAITAIGGTVFESTAVDTFVIDPENAHYAAPEAGDAFLVSKDGGEIIFAFANSKQTDLVIGADSSYNSIGASAFAGSNLTSVTINKNGFIIGDYAFANSGKLERVVLPAGGAQIGEFAFAYVGQSVQIDPATGAEKVIYTDLTVENLNKVSTIGEYAFAGSAVTQADIGAGATVGEGAFYESRVKKVVLGKNTVIGMGAFQNARALTELVLPEVADGEKGGVVLGDACFANDVLLKGTLNFKNVTEVIPLQAFYNCRSVSGVNLSGVITVENSAFAECSSLMNLSFAEYDEDGNEISGSATTVAIGDYSFGKLTTAGVSPSFQKVKLPSTLEYIGDGAFMYCLGLTEITIPEGVTFEAGAQSTAVSLAKTMHFGGNSVFFGCANLVNVTLPQSVTTVGDYMFGSCSSLVNVNLSHVEEIGDYAFAQAIASDSPRTLKTVDLTGAVYIGEAAFANNEALSCDIYAPELLFVSAYAFKDTAVKSFNAPKLIVLGDSAFDCTALGGNKNLKEFAIPSSLQIIGKSVFAGCNALERFVYTENGGKVDSKLINSFVAIESGMLYDITANGDLQLKSVPANLKTLSGQTVTELYVADGTVRIEYYAGNANKNVVKIVLPESLKQIGNYAFYGYTGLLKEDKYDEGWGVYFRSYAAPALESDYDYTASVTLNKDNEYAYGQLHAYLNLFNLELCYYNFVDLVGKNAPIPMYLPDTVNKKTEGYDAVVYKAYFGRFTRTDKSYLAMDGDMSDFVTYAKQIIAILNSREIELSDEALVTKAVAAYSAVKDSDAQKFFGGAFTAQEWASYRLATEQAKEAVRKLKIAQASEKIKALDAELTALPSEFDLGLIDKLCDLTARIDELKGSQRTLLNLDKYNALVAAFGEYMNSVNGAINDIESSILGD